LNCKFVQFNLADSISVPSILRVAELFNTAAAPASRTKSTSVRSYDPSLTVVVNETNSALEPSLTTVLFELPFAIVAEALPVIFNSAAFISVASTSLPLASVQLAFRLNVILHSFQIVG
jgi:hypothetical protein